MKPLSDAEIDYARRLAATETDDLAPARGIVRAFLVGSVLWVIGLVIWFTCF